MNYIQTRSESVSNNGSYLGGVPNQQSDKTQGTASGISSLIQQAQSPIRDRQINIEESIVEPVINKWLRMTGAVMGQDEIKYIFISGQNQRWVRITKGLMTGKITIPDLLESRLIDDAGAMELAQIMMSKGQDPTKELVFDVDWIIRVETNSMAEVDAQADMDKISQWAEFRQTYGIPTDFKKISETLAQAADIKNPEQYDMAPPPASGLPTQGMPMPGMPPGQGAPAMPAQAPVAPVQQPAMPVPVQ
jgi:hypothetical protein